MLALGVRRSGGVEAKSVCERTVGERGLKLRKLSVRTLWMNPMSQ